jgi:hypothetical protein
MGPKKKTKEELEAEAAAEEARKAGELPRDCVVPSCDSFFRLPSAAQPHFLTPPLRSPIRCAAEAKAEEDRRAAEAAEAARREAERIRLRNEGEEHERAHNVSQPRP